MSSAAQSNRQYHFGVFTVDAHAGELRKHGTRLKLQERPFQLLLMLVERPGELITREELRQRFWPDGTFVDFDHSISSSVNKLRAALNDSSSHPRYIETVGRRGYRFLADVKLVPPAPTEAAAVEEEVQKSDLKPETLPPAQRRVARYWLILMGSTALLGIAVAAYLLWPRSRDVRPSPEGKVMLAVLPFVNLTGDASQDYFSDGMTEEMITQLGRLDPRHFGVIARTSVMHYKSSQTNLEQIGRDLGVQYVLEGSIRRDSDKVRITAQLIQVSDQTHLWAQQYDREIQDLLLLQTEIAQKICRQIPITLEEHNPTTPSSQPPLSAQQYEAYNLYLQGLYFWNKRTVDGFQEAIHYFQQAVAKDPNCARAYVGLANSYALIGGYSGIPQIEFAEKARTAALRALEIEPNLAEAHTAFALIVENYDWDWQTAEKEYQRAIQLDPNYATAHHWYAEYLTWRGRFDEAMRESERARRLDPLSLIIATDYGAILYYSRQYDRAIEQFHYVLNMEPRFPRAGLIMDAYTQKGMYTDAEAVIKKFSAENAPWYWSKLAYLYGRSGQQKQSQLALEKLLQLSKQQQFDAATIALAYIGAGNKTEAITWLEKAYTQHSNVIVTLKVDPACDALRGDPRFRDLLHRIGLDS